jgi:protein-disulfide isomerase
MTKKILFGLAGLILLSLMVTAQSFSQEDKIVQVAIDLVRMQGRLPKEMQIQFVEKRESPIPEFYMVKLNLMFPDRETPVVIYVDKGGEKVILGSLFIKGENVTRKEAGESKPRKIDMAQLDIEKSAFRGSREAKVTVVEFSNFECPYCTRSWAKMKELLAKNSQNIKYVFKHFPLQTMPKSFELSEIAGAAQEVSSEAFWIVHDFLFSTEGQNMIKSERGIIVKKVEELLAGKNQDVKVFQTALEKGLGKKRVEADMVTGNKIPIMATPTVIVNGDFIRGGLTDKTLEKYLVK